MEKVVYSNVSIPADKDWRHEIAGLVGSVEALVGFRLVKKTRSGNFIVQISSSNKENLKQVLDLAIEKY